jgi:hypothetical protein
MNTIKLVAVFAENKPGQAARITKVLAQANLNIRCITMASSGAYGVIKILVNEPAQACQALKQEGFAATLTDVVAVEMPDKPGSLYRIADCLVRNNINLENTSGFVANNRAILILEVQNVVQAAEVLQKQGMHVLSQEETMAI